MPSKTISGWRTQYGSDIFADGVRATRGACNRRADAVASEGLSALARCETGSVMGSPGGYAARIYKIKKITILMLFVTYAVVQCAGRVTSPRGEFFPVFSWSLFTSVVNPRWTLEIEVLRVGDTEFDQPVNFFELGEHFEFARRRSTDVRKSAMRVFSLSRQDPAVAESVRRTFEETYLSDKGPVEYQFVALTFDPLVRWRTGETIERHVVARFSTERP